MTTAISGIYRPRLWKSDEDFLSYVRQVHAYRESFLESNSKQKYNNKHDTNDKKFDINIHLPSEVFMSAINSRNYDVRTTVSHDSIEETKDDSYVFDSVAFYNSLDERGKQAMELSNRLADEANARLAAQESISFMGRGDAPEYRSPWTRAVWQIRKERILNTPNSESSSEVEELNASSIRLEVPEPRSSNKVAYVALACLALTAMYFTLRPKGPKPKPKAYTIHGTKTTEISFN